MKDILIHIFAFFYKAILIVGLLGIIIFILKYVWIVFRLFLAILGSFLYHFFSLFSIFFGSKNNTGSDYSRSDYSRSDYSEPAEPADSKPADSKSAGSKPFPFPWWMWPYILNNNNNDNNRNK